MHNLLRNKHKLHYFKKFKIKISKLCSFFDYCIYIFFKFAYGDDVETEKKLCGMGTRPAGTGVGMGTRSGGFGGDGDEQLSPSSFLMYRYGGSKITK